MNKKTRRDIGKVSELGCIVCKRLGYEGTPAEIHHKRAGRGIGNRAGNDQIIPLCPEHHRGKTGLHGLGTKGFVKHYGYDEDDLLAEVAFLLNN